MFRSKFYRSWMVILFIGGVLSQHAVAAAALTRDELLAGCEVPEKRGFPLSKKVAPCEDFYKYVCSEATAKFKLPADRSYWNFSSTDASERLLCAKKTFFKKFEKGYQPAFKSTEQVKNFYLACMDEKSSAAEEKGLLAKELATISAIKTKEELAEFAQNRMDTPDETYLGFHKLPDQSDPTKNDVLIVADLKSLPEPSYYKKPEVVKALGELAQSMFETLKIDNPKERAKWVVDFESALAEKYPTPTMIRERVATNTYMDAKEWEKKYPNLRLQRFIKRLPKNIRIRNLMPESMEFFNAAVETMPLEQIKSALMFQALTEYMDDSNPAFFKKAFAFRKKYLGGPEKRPDRQERCTQESMRRFGMEVDQELLPILFPDFPQEKTVKLAEDIRASILDGLDANTWLSKAARAEAKQKTKNAKLFLVKPLKESDWNFNYPADYDPKKPYANRHLNDSKSLEKLFDELSKPRPQSRWDMSPLTVNAYYSPSDNKFVMLQGILQYPFYDPQMSDIENTAAIGAVMGHELGHGIDDKGSRYDSKGRLRQWMEAADLAEFKKRGGVFVERFNKIGHNGELTLGENIGDHVGIGFAYHAAFKDPSKASVADKQKFFQAYGRLWCQTMRPEFQQYLLKVDSHAMGYGRVNEQLLHQDGFYEAFSCKAGDKMYLDPKDRVRVW